MNGKRARKVFGRLKIELEGREYLFEMRTEGVRVHRKYARKSKLIPFSDLLDLAIGQRRFMF